MSRNFEFNLYVAGTNKDNFMTLMDSEANTAGWDTSASPLYTKSFSLSTTNESIISGITTLINDCNTTYPVHCDCTINYILHWVL